MRPKVHASKSTCVFRDFGSHRPQDRCIRSKIWCRRWFWRQKLPSSSKINRKSRKTEKKIAKKNRKKIFFVNFFFDSKLFETRFGNVLQVKYWKKTAKKRRKNVKTLRKFSGRIFMITSLSLGPPNAERQTVTLPNLANCQCRPTMPALQLLCGVRAIC